MQRSPWWLPLLLALVGLSIAGLAAAGRFFLPSQRFSISDSSPTQPVHTDSPTIVPSPFPAVPQTITFVFTGDMMFDRHIRENARRRGGYETLLSPGIQAVFAEADLVVGNLEGPVTDQPSRSVGSAVGSPANYIFTFEPAVVEFLATQHITLVNLGNNHILNFGQNGLEETYQRLTQSGIGYFGATGRDKPYQRWVTREFDGVTVAFVNYNQFTPDGWSQALSDLAQVQPLADLTIVYTHWGNEYVPENAVLKQQARQLVEAGADLIIGSHPHVVTGNELIGDVPIYYSLGNFIFDQYFQPEVRQGLLVKAEYNLETATFTLTELPVKLEPNGTTSLLEEAFNQ